MGLYKNKAKNIKTCCRQICQEYGGKVPDKLEEVLKLAGVGRKTGTLFLADAYGIPGVTVDTHVFRISRRLGWAEGKNPVEVEQELMKVLPEDHWNRINFQLIYQMCIRDRLTITITEPALCTKAPTTGFRIPVIARIMAMKFNVMEKVRLHLIVSIIRLESRSRCGSMWISSFTRAISAAVSYTHLDVYKRQHPSRKAPYAHALRYPPGAGCSLPGDVYKRQPLFIQDVSSSAYTRDLEIMKRLTTHTPICII